MARRLVYFCIGLLTIIVLWAMALKTYAVHEQTSVDLTDVLTFAGAVFAGELLMLLVKRLVAKPDDKEEEE